MSFLGGGGAPVTGPRGVPQSHAGSVAQSSVGGTQDGVPTVRMGIPLARSGWDNPSQNEVPSQNRLH